MTTITLTNKFEFEKPAWRQKQETPEVSWHFRAHTSAPMPHGHPMIAGELKKGVMGWRARSWSMKHANMEWGQYAPTRETAIANIIDAAVEAGHKGEAELRLRRQKELVMSEIRQTEAAPNKFAQRMYAVLQEVQLKMPWCSNEGAAVAAQ